MNNPIKLLISGADMGGLIASCALHHDFHESSRHTDGFQCRTELWGRFCFKEQETNPASPESGSRKLPITREFTLP